MAAPKKYPDELKARAVRLYRESDSKPTIRKLAEQLGVHHEAASSVPNQWVTKQVSRHHLAENRLYAVLSFRGSF